MMTNEPIKLWQLLEGWFDQANIGWKVGVAGETSLVQKIDNPDWHYYIGDDYVATYPSCASYYGGGKLIAADPEFLDKLKDFLVHVDNCLYCVSTKEINEIMIKDLMSEVSRSVDRTYTQMLMMKAVNSYYTPPKMYSDIIIAP